MDDSAPWDLGELYRKARRLRVFALREVRTWLSGASASIFRGPGVEFDEFKPYQPGDDVRRIDWQVTARRREPFVKRYVQERELRVILALDVSRSMARTGPAHAARASAHEVAAVAALSAALSGDRVGAILFADKVLDFLPARHGEKHAMSVIRAALGRQGSGQTTDLRPALRSISRLRGHAVVFLLSDFLTKPAPWEAEVQRLLSACAKRHRMVAVRFLSPESERLPADVLVAAEQAESPGRILLDAFGAQRAKAVGLLERHRELTRSALAACGVSGMELRPGETYTGKLQQLLVHRRSGPATGGIGENTPSPEFSLLPHRGRI